MNNKIIQRVVILGTLAIMFVIAAQTYLVTRTWNLREREFDQTINIALQNVARELSVVNQSVLPPQDLIKPLSSNTFSVNINSQIDASLLDFYLRKNLESTTEDYDYAIYDCHDEKMVYGKYVTFSASSDTSSVRKNDFPRLDNPTAIYYFVVRFPKRTSSILVSMGVTIFLPSFRC